MNDYNQTLAAIRHSKEIIEKVLPGVTEPNVKKSLESKRDELNMELENMLKRGDDF